MRASFVMSGVATGLRRNLSMTVALVLNTAIALSFAGGAIMVSNFIGKFQNNYENQLSVSIYLCGPPPYTPGSSCTAKVTPAQRQALQSKLLADARISGVNYVDEKQAYDKGKKILSKEEAEFLEPGQLPTSFTLKLTDIKRDFPGVSQAYSRQPGVDAVSDQSDSLKTLLTIFEKARIGAAVAAIAIMICAMLLMANAIQVAANQRRNETGIMRLVGASRWMTQLPFMIEAVLAAALGGILAIVLDYFGKVVILDNIFKQQVENRVLPSLDTNQVIEAAGIGALAGIVLAALTAYATLRLLVRL